MRVGIDVGGVIIGTDTDSKIRNVGDTMFQDNFFAAPAQPGMFDAVKNIVHLAGKDNVFIISKCRKKMQAKTLAWLWYHDFYKSTGFDYTHVFFVEQRPDKAPLGRALDLDVFIDDRQDVLDHMIGAGLRHPILYESWDQTMGIIRQLKDE